MWILLRLILALVVWLFSWSRHTGRPAQTGDRQGVPVFTQVETNKNRITGYRMGIARALPFVARISRETGWDVFFKRFRWVHEPQTGDADFDAAFYIECDQPEFARLLGHDARLRDLIRRAFTEGCHRLHMHAGWVSLEKRTDTDDSDTLWPLLEELSRRLQPVAHVHPLPLHRRYLFRAGLLESAVWSLAVFAATIPFEYLLSPGTRTVTRALLWGLGLGVAAFLGVLFLAITVWWMRGSARGHRIIVESALVLLASLPFVGTQLVLDIDRQWEFRSQDTLVRYPLKRAWQETHHRGRGVGKAFSYHATFGLPLDGAPCRLPEEVQITEAQWRVLSPVRGGTPVEVRFRRGALGLCRIEGYEVADER